MSEFEIYESFEDMELSTNLLRGIFTFGWEFPSDIQKKIIVPITTGRDVIAQAQSGSGKTGAFTISSLQLIDWSLNKPQIIIISPTRELAVQTNNIAKGVGTYLFSSKNYKPIYTIGGTNVSNDIQTIRNQNVVYISATPGRIYDILSRKIIDIENIKMVVIDEADEMLSQGFKEQVHNILNILPKKIQISLFSATMPPEVIEIADTFMKKPLKLLMDNDKIPLEGIKQFIVNMEEDDKIAALMDLYDSVSINQSMIFVNNKRKVDWLTKKMTTNGFVVSAIHAGMEKEQRENIMEEFRNGKSRILISTDLLARGIDIHHVSIVINYDISSDCENYIHRIGRAGRYGRKGLSINFIGNPSDRENLKSIEKYYKIQIEELPTDFEKYLR